LLDPAHAERGRALQRFAAEAPNALWQLDFKGGLRVAGAPAHPLHVLDDHSRYLLRVELCADQGFLAVQAALTDLFREVGLPERILTDNGIPWGNPPDPGALTRLGVWWLRLGIRISHGRPFHPQTQGKVERTMQTAHREALATADYPDATTLQDLLDRWRHRYNSERPHEALDGATPASRYQPSPRPFPEALPPMAYPADLLIRTVSAPGVVSLHDRRVRISHALIGEPVAFRPIADGVYAVYYGTHYLRSISLHGPPRHR
jgi:transposase InsO family protein